MWIPCWHVKTVLASDSTIKHFTAKHRPRSSLRHPHTHFALEYMVPCICVLTLHAFQMVHRGSVNAQGKVLYVHNYPNPSFGLSVEVCCSIIGN